MVAGPRATPPVLTPPNRRAIKNVGRLWPWRPPRPPRAGRWGYPVYHGCHLVKLISWDTPRDLKVAEFTVTEKGAFCSLKRCFILVCNSPQTRVTLDFVVFSLFYDKKQRIKLYSRIKLTVKKVHISKVFSKCNIKHHLDTFQIFLDSKCSPISLYFFFIFFLMSTFVFLKKICVALLCIFNYDILKLSYSSFIYI